MARKRNVCRNPNVGFCVNKTMGGPGLMHKNVSKTSLFPTSGFWWRPRRKVCCDRARESEDDTVLVPIELDMPFSELDLALLAQDLERLGDLYRDMQDIPQAFLHYDRAIKIYFQLGDTKGVGDLLEKIKAIRGKGGISVDPKPYEEMLESTSTKRPSVCG